jgi:hypothetical protein
MYVDSQGNHAFPLVALHGALWGHDFFRTAKLLENVGKLFHAIGNMQQLLDEIDQFSLALWTTNRQVFIDTYTNYWFSKKYGREPGAVDITDKDVLPYLNRVHEMVRSGKSFSPEEKREVFAASLNTEQKDTVAERMDEAANNVKTGWLKSLMTKPKVHFTYFPDGLDYKFENFTDRADRVRAAMLAYDTAVNVGWTKVSDTMVGYHELPDAYFADRAAYAKALREKLLARASR